jgi:hypothetical protein
MIDDSDKDNDSDEDNDVISITGTDNNRLLNLKLIRRNY